MKKKSVSPAMPLTEQKAYLISALKNGEIVLPQKIVTAGFDGFVDTIVKVIKSKQPDKPSTLFTTIEEFGNYIVEKKGASLSLEIEERSSKPGGNMPIMANALGQLDITVNCIGALGHPQIHTAFKNFPTSCNFYSFTNPGVATAFEFNDGKIIMAQMAELNGFGWDKLKTEIGLDTIISLYKQSDLVCLLNWSEIDASTDIWKGLLKDVLPKYSTHKEQIAFFDLSDCSKRSKESIAEALQLIQEFAKHTRVILSLNKNEAGLIFKTLLDKDSKKDLFDTGKSIFEAMDIDTLVVHSAKQVAAFTNDDDITLDSFFIEDPKISTGAGDNFNGGFCAAQLLALDLCSSAMLANAVSGYYVRNGKSGQLPDIIHFLENI
jgi:hypothetical protein